MSSSKTGKLIMNAVTRTGRKVVIEADAKITVRDDLPFAARDVHFSEITGATFQVDEETEA